MADRQKYLTAAFMHECFICREGKLIWKERPVHHFVDEWRQKIFNSRQAGKEVGTIVNDYRIVRFSWGRISCHRIVFLMHHSFLPEEVDHVNGDKSDNRIENLRACNRQQNIANTRSRGNKNGFKGVSANGKRFSAHITINGRNTYLGNFLTPEEAHQAYCRAAKRIHGEFARYD